MTGTQNHEGIAGVLAAVEYLAALGRQGATAGDPALGASRRPLTPSAGTSADCASSSSRGSRGCGRCGCGGLRTQNDFDRRVPTVSITHARRSPVEVAQHLAGRGIFAWHGNFYALELTESLGLEPAGLVRLGLLHYNTLTEVERLLAALAELE